MSKCLIVKRLILFLAGAVILPLTLCAQIVNDVDVKVVLHQDGSATITQVWDVEVFNGTEWYIPISNLGKMTVGNLRVSEGGKQFVSEGDNWDVERSLAQKMGRCGIVRKRKGVELCWGQGAYGHHVWEATFDVTGLVQSLKDCDAFNFQFINTGLAATPGHGRVTIVNDTGSDPWTSENTRVWGFGYEGTVNVVDGAIVAEAPMGIRTDGHMTIMTRFEKGLFQPTVSQNKSFDKMRRKAFKGSSYSSGGGLFSWLGSLNIESLIAILAGLFAVLYFIYASICSALGYKYEKNFFGKSKITEWYRQAPLDGYLPAAYYVLKKGHRFGYSQSENLIGAYFLRWVLDGYIKVIPDGKRVNLDFRKDDEVNFVDSVEGDLYTMARSASGENLILEKGEFEKWSDKHFDRVTKWPDKAEKAGKEYLAGKGLVVTGKTTPPTTQRALSTVIEFQNFLNDFTLAGERGVLEVGLWKDYLVYAQLYGIADKVSEQLGKLFPAQMEQYAKDYGMDYRSMLWAVSYSNSMASATMSRAMSHLDSSSSGGFGGRSSFGGGGGFSGGGHGGGSR